MDVMQYLGRSWRRGEYDCWEFVRDVYKKELGIELPVVGIDATNYRAVMREFDNSSIYGLFVREASPKNFDVVGIRTAGRVGVSHVGVYLERSQAVIHNAQGRGVTVQSISFFHRLGLLEGFYRYRG